MKQPVVLLAPSRKLMMSAFTLCVLMVTPAAIAQEAITLRAATESVISTYGGEVLKADEVMRDGKPAYRIRLIANGRVKEYFIDPTNGQELVPR